MSDNPGGMTINQALAEMARVINASFPTPPERPYLGNRCGWYPAKPKRVRKAKR